jgi:hypothetical protein
VSVPKLDMLFGAQWVVDPEGHSCAAQRRVARIRRDDWRGTSRRDGPVTWETLTLLVKSGPRGTGTETRVWPSWWAAAGGKGNPPREVGEGEGTTRA